jgi:2-(1,2-epoxy-1,2-dihydrophenyl)acetyl-CoA isomerase
VAAVLFDRKGAIVRITLNRPDRLNSIDDAMRRELLQATAAAAEAGTRALILTGAGRAFCTGQDLAERVMPPGSPPPDLGQSIETFYKPLVLALRALPVPVIAAVNGAAAGAGASLALACDIVLASRQAVFIQAFSKLGLGPDCGGSYFLPRLVGTARAMGLVLTADKLSAEQAEQWGLIWKCVDDDKLMPEAEALAQRFAEGPPLAYAAIRQVMYASPHHTLAQQLDLERDTQRALGYSEDYREGVAAFMEKRTPAFRGK